jgi:hypothetical protein
MFLFWNGSDRLAKPCWPSTVRKTAKDSMCWSLHSNRIRELIFFIVISLLWVTFWRNNFGLVWRVVRTRFSTVMEAPHRNGFPSCTWTLACRLTDLRHRSMQPFGQWRPVPSYDCEITTRQSISITLISMKHFFIINFTVNPLYFLVVI